MPSFKKYNEKSDICAVVINHYSKWAWGVEVDLNLRPTLCSEFPCTPCFFNPYYIRGGDKFIRVRHNLVNSARDRTIITLL